MSSTVMKGFEDRLSLARLLASRLERISADSIWARRASGTRGNLLKWIEILESVENDASSLEAPAEEPLEDLLHRVDWVISSGFEVLAKAAREIPGTKEFNG